jgi:hypothetical protein
MPDEGPEFFVTVGALVAQLLKFPQDAEVRLLDADTGWQMVIDKVESREKGRVLVGADYYSAANYGEINRVCK